MVAASHNQLRWPHLTINLVSKNGGRLSRSTYGGRLSRSTYGGRLLRSTYSGRLSRINLLSKNGGRLSQSTYGGRLLRSTYVWPPLMIVRGGHLKIFKFAKIHYTKWHKTWLTLFIYYPINQERWPPLGTTFLGQAVCTY
jgi:hypothetical protein